MAIFLMVLSAFVGFAGFAFMIEASNVLHEIFGGIGIVTAAVLFSAGGICSEIGLLRKEQKKLLTEIRDRLKEV